MTKLMSALLAGAVTIALAPAASAQAWNQVPDQIVTRYTGPDPINYNDVTVFQGDWDAVRNSPWSVVELRNGRPPLVWGPNAEIFDYIHGWHPRLSESQIPDVIRDRAPWRGYLPAQPAAGTSDRVYEDLLLSLSIRSSAWGRGFASLGAYDDDGLQDPIGSNLIPDGWVVTDQCLGRGTVWYGDMGLTTCVDGYAMRSLTEPPRRPHHL